LLIQPGDGWNACLLREQNELLVNIGELGLTGNGYDARELITDIGALLVCALREV
jgi:hypothetical protein